MHRALGVLGLLLALGGIHAAFNPWAWRTIPDTPNVEERKLEGRTDLIRIYGIGTCVSGLVLLYATIRKDEKN